MYRPGDASRVRELRMFAVRNSTRTYAFSPASTSSDGKSADRQPAELTIALDDDVTLHARGRQNL